MVANHVAASSNLPASNASQAISEAICIAFLAASARSFVFSLVAARSASSFLNCASSCARSGFAAAVGFASSQRTPAGTTKLTRRRAVKTKRARRFIALLETLFRIMFVKSLCLEMINSFPVVRRIDCQIVAPLRHQRARLILFFIAQRCEQSFGFRKISVFVGGKGGVIALDNLFEVSGTVGMLYLQQLEWNRLSLHNCLVDQTHHWRVR